MPSAACPRPACASPSVSRSSSPRDRCRGMPRGGYGRRIAAVVQSSLARHRRSSVRRRPHSPLSATRIAPAWRSRTAFRRRRSAAGQDCDAIALGHRRRGEHGGDLSRRVRSARHKSASAVASSSARSRRGEASAAGQPIRLSPIIMAAPSRSAPPPIRPSCASVPFQTPYLMPRRRSSRSTPRREARLRPP